MVPNDRNCVMVTFWLNPVTKSDRARTADVIIAYTTRSGFLSASGFTGQNGTGPDLQGPISAILLVPGTSWTSRFFLTTYLYPSLHQQRLASDPLLLPFDDTASNTIEIRFWRLRRSNEKVDASYREWKPSDRVKITLYYHTLVAVAWGEEIHSVGVVVSCGDLSWETL